MTLHTSRMLVLDRRPKGHHSPSLGAIGDRFAALFRSTARSAEDSAPPPLTHSALNAGETAGEDRVPRFPLARRGYDCVAVDGYVADLEQELTALDRELAEVRASSQSQDQAAAELKRLGEQTSAVLMAAHEQREEILRRAQAEAERCVADAKATASSVTAQSEERLRELTAQTQAAQTERDRLLCDLRTISTALADVAEAAGERSGKTEEFAQVAT